MQKKKASPSTLADDWHVVASMLLVVSLCLNAGWIMHSLAPLFAPPRGPEEVFGGIDVSELAAPLTEQNSTEAPRASWLLRRNSGTGTGSEPGLGRGKTPSSAAWGANSEEVMEAMENFVAFPGSDICGSWHVNYTLLHQRMRRGEIPGKFLTFTPGTNCGLGDNMNGLVTSFIAALLSDRGFSMTESYLETSFDPGAIDWRVWDGVPTKITTILRQGIRNGSVFGMYRQNGWRASFDEGYVKFPTDVKYYMKLLDGALNVVVSTNGGILSQIFSKKHDSTYKALHSMGLRMPYAFGCIARYLLKPKPEVLRLLQAPLTALHVNSSSVCLHLRTTDDLAWSQNSAMQKVHSRQMAQATEVADAMFICARRFCEMWLPQSRQYRWLFLSDSQHVVKQMQSRYHDKVLTSALKPSHVGNSGFSGRQFAAADWLLFSSCDMHILSESGFSKTASAYNYRTPHRLLLGVRWDSRRGLTRYAIVGCQGTSPSSLLDFRKWSGL